MRVAYLVNLYPATSHSFIRREIRAVEAQGIEVARFSLRPPELPLPTEADRVEAGRTRVIQRAGATEFAAAAGHLLLRRPAKLLAALAAALRLGWRSERGVLVHLAYLAEACLLVRWLERERCEHLHAHFATNPAAVALLCHELGGPTFSFTVHGPHEFDRPEFIGLREKMRRASFTVAISSYGRSQLYRWSDHRDWPRIEVVRCGVPRDLLDARPVPVPDVARLVCVARLGEQKGHLLLVEAAARLRDQGVPFELVLVGEGPLRDEIARLVREGGLQDRVRLAGAMSADQVRDAILASRAMVLPSFAEGLPVVIMEALALGRPVISTAIAGTPELVVPGANGWLIPAGSVEALVAAMREALETPPSRLTAMGLAGAGLVARLHDVDREAGRLAALFRAASRGGAGAPPRAP